MGMLSLFGYVALCGCNATSYAQLCFQRERTLTQLLHRLLSVSGLDVRDQWLSLNVAI